MRNYYKTIKSTCLLMAAVLLMGAQANATTFTALASGSFSSTSTWAGGIVPVSLTTGDNIIIGSGINITLDQDITLSSGSSMNIDGMLMGSNGYFIDMQQGSTLTGNGSIDVDSIAMHNTSMTDFVFDGSVTTGALLSDNATLSGTTNNTVIVENTLRLAAGIMTMSGGTLQLQQGSVIVVEDGTINVTGGNIGLTNSYSVMYTGSSNTNGGLELTGGGLSGIVIDLGASNNLSLQSDLVLDGMLDVRSGNLELNGNNLTIAANGDVMFAANTGISSSSNSDITINATNSLSNSIRFTTGGNTVDDFTVNLGTSSASASIDGDLMVSGQLAMNNGRLNIGSGNLEIMTGGSFTGGSNNSFVIAENGGRLSINVMTNSSQMFHVGTSTEYTPAVIAATSTSGSSKFSVGVDENVMVDGNSGAIVDNTQSMVSNTWFIESSASANVEVDIELMWDASMEVNGFDRTKANIAHYTNGMWDVDASSSATASGSMYSLTRTGVKSFSPFAVFDENTAVSVDDIDVNTTVAVYPNPVVNTVNISLTENNEVLNAAIYNVSGQQVYNGTMTGNNTNIDVSNLADGMYYIQLKGDNTNATQKFIKQ